MAFLLTFFSQSQSQVQNAMQAAAGPRAEMEPVYNTRGEKSWFFKTAKANEKQKRIVVVGGGTAGLSIASQILRRKLPDTTVTIVEPSGKHYYQPLWTLVGGGVFDKSNSVRDEASLIPAGATWIKQAVVEFNPDNNNIKTDLGDVVPYDYLVVATGITPDLAKIKGLEESLGSNGVSTIYDYNMAEKTFENIKNFKGGVALFTFPSAPIKCAGAPLKIMWLAEDYFRNTSHVRDKTRVIYNTPLPSLFGVKKYADVMARLAKERGVEVNNGYNLVEIKGKEKIAVFSTPEGPKPVSYDLLHVALPFQSIPAVAASPLAASNGFVDVDKYTLQHNKYKNVFAAGDCANVPTSKTAAAITQQAPCVVSNLVSSILGRPLSAKYDGYTSCPLIVGYNQLVLAEFKYDGVVSETFPWDQSKPSMIGYYMKTHLFPFVYWNGLVKGRWYGPSTIFSPFE